MNEQRDRRREKDQWASKGVTLLEVLVAMAILSTLMLPIGMFLIEYLRGSNQLGDAYQVMNVLEEKMEQALARPFSGFPAGETSNKKLVFQGREMLDLRPLQLGTNLIHFSLKVEPVPVELSAVIDPETGEMVRTLVEDGMKRLVLKGTWGKDRRQALELTAYKADL